MIRVLVCSFLLVVAALAQAQSSLPPCPAGTATGWNNCFGTKTFPSGARYEGEFRADKYHGRGSFFFASGQVYVGDYRDGQRNGQGIFTFPNGEKYSGTFLDGKYHGIGTLAFPNGDTYTGEWRDDKRNGRGTYRFADGRRFVGDYRDGKRQGQGVLYDRSATVLQSGTWENGDLARTHPVDTNAFPFGAGAVPAASDTRTGQAQGQAQAQAQVQAERQKREALERELAEERRKRVEAERRSTPDPAASTGTGFMIAPGYLITNQHVVDDCPRPEIHSADGRRVGAVVDTDDLVDLALIRVTGLRSNVAVLRRPGSVRLGEPAYAFGFPLSGMLTEDGNFTNGVVSALKGLRNSANEFQMTTPVQPGNSGGAVIDSAGNVIGVVVSKLNAAAVAKMTGDIPQNVNFAVSLQALVDFLTRNKVGFRYTERTAPLETSQIAETTRAFTHRIVCPENTARAPQRAPGGQGAGQAGGSGIDTTVVLWNQARESIFAIHLSPVSSDKWGPDLLGKDVLMAGDKFTLQPPTSQGCHYDVRVEFESGKSQEKRNQDFCELVDLKFDGSGR